jgi:broad-specificity NMP kinase
VLGSRTNAVIALIIVDEGLANEFMKETFVLVDLYFVLRCNAPVIRDRLTVK